MAHTPPLGTGLPGAPTTRARHLPHGCHCATRRDCTGPNAPTAHTTPENQKWTPDPRREHTTQRDECINRARDKLRSAPDPSRPPHRPVRQPKLASREWHAPGTNAHARGGRHVTSESGAAQPRTQSRPPPETPNPTPQHPPPSTPHLLMLATDRWIDRSVSDRLMSSATPDRHPAHELYKKKKKIDVPPSEAY